MTQTAPTCLHMSSDDLKLSHQISHLSRQHHPKKQQPVTVLTILEYKEDDIHLTCNFHIYIYIIYSIYTLNPFQDLPRNNRFFFFLVFLEIKARRPDVDERMEASRSKIGNAWRRCQMRTVTFCLWPWECMTSQLNHQMTFFGLKH